MPQFEGVIDDIVYRNDSNGYTVLALKPDKGRAFTVVGMFPMINSGERLFVEGEWTEHRDYGKQLKMTHFEMLEPTTKSGIERYLASGIIKGVGPATAKLLVKAFGDQTLDVLDNHPDRLIEIEGIGPKRARQIADSYQEQRASRMIMVYLAGFGLTPGISLKIYNLQLTCTLYLRIIIHNPHILIIVKITFNRMLKRNFPLQSRFLCP
ncbi:MAG: hypothetical protein II266_01820, partial [Clostridia bacterium]|nr:hypothetical protein [Clostridia bacterium]